MKWTSRNFWYCLVAFFLGVLVSGYMSVDGLDVGPPIESDVGESSNVGKEDWRKCVCEKCQKNPQCEGEPIPAISVLGQHSRPQTPCLRCGQETDGSDHGGRVPTAR
jgi:hypothetical protein